MEPRMTQPAMVVPGAMGALMALGKSLEAAQALPPATRALVHLRASQINGCSWCVDMHARELIKITVLKNCLDDGRSIAEVLAERTRSEVVQVIGKKIVLYKPAKDEAKRKIVLP